jgi:hypothetical protein
MSRTILVLWLGVMALAPGARAAEAAEAADDADHRAHAGMSGMSHAMPGLLGGYAMAREASGTAWQPESTPHEGHMVMGDDWTWMLHGTVQFAYTDQGGPRGDQAFYTPMMFMAMGSRDWGDGRIGLRAMVSPEAAQMGKTGYPLLLQTGETANGVDHLIDRQHPHDLFMELALTAGTPLADGLDGFAYLAVVGEPALGPPVFMHRFSGMEFPAATITHHWLDSTHITFGVVTLGAIREGWKLEGSAFRGREPDQYRYDIESGRLDSWSTRLTWNPDESWSLQVSAGDIISPEQLEPTVNVFRTTASAIHGSDRFGGYLQSTLAWGRNEMRGGGHDTKLDAWLLESTWRIDARWTLLGRYEHALKNELFQAGDPAGDPHDEFHVNALSVGAIRELTALGDGTLGLGLLLSKSLVPAELEDDYGGDPNSVTVFLRLRL